MKRWLLLLSVLFLGGCLNVTQLPPGLAFESPERPAASVSFLTDLTWVDAAGNRHVEQEIFDEIFSVIRNARRFILLDMFLYNDFQGKKPELNRALSDELTELLIQQKQAYPNLQIFVITDPINTVYGGIVSRHFSALTSRGIQVVITDLNRLPDSNPCYSLPWRLFVKPFGTPPGGLMPNPFGEGRVSVRSWLKLLNFKANHRKVLVADAGDTLVGMVTSANPHDGSSAHRNAALKFSGQAALDLLKSELPVFELSGLPPPDFDLETLQIADEASDYRLQVLTEIKIKEAVLQLLNAAKAGDEIDLVLFYLSEREVIRALIAAQHRGVSLRIVLDPNKDAFGWKKNGIPNRQVAEELDRHKVAVRWCDTHGEQCHGKTLIVAKANGETDLLTGSANYTRRNLNNFNLETDVWVKTRKHTEVARKARAYFNRLWTNEDNRQYSVDYEVYENKSILKQVLYRFQEATGMSSF